MGRKENGGDGQDRRGQCWRLVCSDSEVFCGSMSVRMGKIVVM